VSILQTIMQLPEATAFLQPDTSEGYAAKILPATPFCLSDCERWLASSIDIHNALHILRTPFLNALRFYTLNATIRKCAIKLLGRLDDAVQLDGALCTEMAQAGTPFVAARSAFPESPACHSVLEQLLLEPGLHGYPAVFYFWYPLASYYDDGSDNPFVKDYYKRCPSPSYLAECAARLHDAQFSSLNEFRAAVTLVFENARRYSAPDIAAASSRLLATFETLLSVTLLRAPVGLVQDAASPPVTSTDSRGSHVVGAPRRSPSDHHAAQAGPQQSGLTRDEAKRCIDLLNKLESATVTTARGATVRVAKPFLYPVERLIADYPDYSAVISNPIDLLIIRRKLELEPPDYASVHDFSADVKLVVVNCERYNASDESYETRLVAGWMWEKFKLLYSDAFYGYSIANTPSVYSPGQTTRRSDSASSRVSGAPARRVHKPAALNHRATGITANIPAVSESLGAKLEAAVADAAPAPRLKLKLSRPTKQEGTTAAHMRDSLAMTAPEIAQSSTLQASESSAASAGVSAVQTATAPSLGPVPARSAAAAGGLSRLKLRVPRPDWDGPRTLVDFPLATNKALQVSASGLVVFYVFFSRTESNSRLIAA
jgi:hypothetical protein